MKSSPLSKDNTLVKKWLDEQSNLMENYKKYSYDEIKDFLTKWLNPEEVVEVNAVVTEPNKAFETSNTPKPKTKPIEVITSSEFDDIFGE